MGRVSHEKIRRALDKAIDPALGTIGDIQIGDGGHVIVSIVVDPAKGGALEPMRQKVESAVSKIKGVKNVSAILTAEASPDTTAKPSVPDPHGMNKNPRLNLPIRHIIAVSSGKGGVGKSTVAANLAIALGQSGLSVGLLDADIYGPSQPRMMGLDGQKPEQVDGQIVPLTAHGISVMSIGFMINDTAPLVWRGPMVQSAIYQMLRDVKWADDGEMLDVLIVDMPPGTGDAQLTMAQKVPLAGAMIVSTPQDIALLDARKGIGMFEKVGVPVLGIIENMSTHVCSNCGHEEHIFGADGAKAEAETHGVPFLGAIPLHIDIRTSGDAGTPVVVGDAAQGNVFAEIGKALKESLLL